MKRNRILYSLMSLGLIGAFFGHGMWAVRGEEKFAELFVGTSDNVLGVTVSTDTATNWVEAIGWFDVAVTVALVAMLVGVILGRGALYELAYSRAALVIYAWGALWGFLTAGSRVTAAGQFYPEVWDVVERAPNFMLPAALIYLVYQHRLDHKQGTPTAAEIELTKPAA